MSEQKTTTAVQGSPAPEGYQSWPAYWEMQGMLWRTEPEIDEQRQRYLAERRPIVPDVVKGIYPFRDVKLDRADVEWLLATHEHEGGQGPVYLHDMNALFMRGLDLRGADLCAADLSNLPLTSLLGGITPNELESLPGSMQQEAIANAAIHFNSATLTDAHLEAAILTGANLERAHLEKAHLEAAMLNEALLSGAVIIYAHLEGSYLIDARLNEVTAFGAHLEGAQLAGAQIQGSRLDNAHLEGALLVQARLEATVLKEAHLEGADLQQAHLEGAMLNGATLCGKQMEASDLERIRRWQPTFLVNQPGADLRKVTFDARTDLKAVSLCDKVHGSVRIADVLFQGVNLAVVDWKHVTTLGEDQDAEKLDKERPRRKQEGVALNIRQAAVRANRQLAGALRDQNLNEEADPFSYNAQRLQTRVIRHQTGKRAEWLFREILDKLAGFGYHWERTVYWYLGVVFLSTLVYFWQNMVFLPHSPWYEALGEALVAAITALHGRGFFPEASQSGVQLAMAAFDAMAGLIIEASFVATFTQRFFAR